LKHARFTKHARAELLGQTAYDEALEKGLGVRFRPEVEAAAQSAVAYPLHGKPSAGGTRRRLVTDFPFSVVYTEVEDGILIHAVADSRRLPEEGTLNGRKGSFVLQHTGTMNKGAPNLSITVVPDSGTGDLVGLSGDFKIINAEGKHSYVFEYSLP
jgi:hypothetical protein